MKMIPVIEKRLLIVGLISTVLFLPPMRSSSQDPNCSIDAQIILQAMINPYVFNATIYQNKAISGFNEFETNYLNPDMARNQLHTVSYALDSQSSIVFTTNITIYSGQLVHFVVFSRDVEHGILLGEESNPQLDIYGGSISITIPRDDLVEFYYLAPQNAQELEVRCTFFCGAGHFNHLLVITVVENTQTIDLHDSSTLGLCGFSGQETTTLISPTSFAISAPDSWMIESLTILIGVVLIGVTGFIIGAGFARLLKKTRKEQDLLPSDDLPETRE